MDDMIEDSQRETEAVVDHLGQPYSERKTFFVIWVFRLLFLSIGILPWVLIPSPESTNSLLPSGAWWFQIPSALVLTILTSTVVSLTFVQMVIIFRFAIPTSVSLYYLGGMWTMRTVYIYQITALLLSTPLRLYFYAIAFYFPWAQPLAWIVWAFIFVAYYGQMGRSGANWLEFIDTNQKYLTDSYKEFLKSTEEDDGVIYNFNSRTG